MRKGGKMEVTRVLRWGGLVGALALGSGVPSPAPAVAQSKPAAKTGASPEKIKDIRRLIELSGSTTAGVQALQQMVGVMRIAMPSAPAGYWEEFTKEARPAEFAELMVPVLDHRLTHDDVKAIIAFYESPAGKRLAAATPAITQEAMQVAVVWGAQTGQRVRARLKP
jgi:hypothetical protein